MTSRLLPALAILASVAAPAAGQTPNSTQADFFESRIRPVLVEHCYPCHSAAAPRIRGGLRLDTAASLLRGGDSGPVIDAGKPQDSLLIEALRHESLQMPPDRRLPAPIIDDFVAWISSGALDPRTLPEGGESATRKESSLDIEQGRQFWSFQPVRRSPWPAVQDQQWPAGPIDRYVLARIEQAGLRPASAADRASLLRRVTMDLWGVPPTIESLRAFLEDPSPPDVALARVVDHLLASPRFGERWGRHWLDVARYADSTGGGRSLLYRQSWRYRDYVLDAINRDLPLNRFLIEQIAGDLLPFASAVEGQRQWIATGFLALGPHNYEQQDKELLRMDVIDEQIDTLGRALLGMTLGCARCHDHKFDPIPTSDYYALAGIFRSTRSLVDGNVSAVGDSRGAHGSPARTSPRRTCSRCPNARGPRPTARATHRRVVRRRPGVGAGR